jgi:neutral ceramidase
MTISPTSKTSRWYLAICLAYGLAISGCGGDTSNTTILADSSTTTSSFKAGAGGAEIVFPAAMFTTPSAIEGFGGTIHDNPHARVMVLESNSKVAIVSLELVRTDADAVAMVKDIVNQYTGTPKNNIWVHSNHTITTPHEPSDATLKALWMASLKTAITTAAQAASTSFQPATAGFGTGTSDVNENRNVLMSDGQYHIGLGGTLLSNKTMTILKVNATATGNPIGYIMSYGVKPTAIDNAGQAAGVRQISSDVPGLACTMMEKQFGVPTLFLMGASGDQTPKYDGLRAMDNGGGSVTDNVDFYPLVGMPYIIAQMTTLGTQMGNDAIGIAKTITANQSHPTITYGVTTFQWPDNMNATLTSQQVDAIRFGDSAFVGFKPEVDAATEQQLQAAAQQMGFAHLMLDSFLAGDSKYMPHAAAYTAPLTVEAKKTGFAVGAAEELVKTSLKLLNGFMGLDATDTTPPSAITTLSTTAATAGPVVITVSAYDDLSGVSAITTPSGAIVQGSTTTYSVTTNGTYSFTVTDNAANTTTVTVTVSNITH